MRLTKLSTKRMTTVIAKEKQFVAVDSKWSLSSAPLLELSNHPIKKYVYSSNGTVMNLFAGDEIPILLRQASLLKLITQNSFVNLSARAADRGYEIECMTVDPADGEFMTRAPSSYGQVAYLGTGGIHAAQFHHYSSREESYQVTDICCIDRAIAHAYRRDNDSGGIINKKIWQEPNLDNTINTDSSSYKTALLERLRTLIMLIGTNAVDLEVAAAKKGVVPPLRTSPTGTVAKATLSGAISFLNEQQEIEERIRLKHLKEASNV